MPMYSILLTQASEDGSPGIRIEVGRDSDAIAAHALVQAIRQALPPRSQLVVSLVRHPHTASNGVVEPGALLRQYRYGKRWDAEEQCWIPKRTLNQTPVMDLPVSTRLVETT